MKNYWKNIFNIDHRSVALCRMGVALCMLWDCLERLQDAKDFLTDYGVVPISLYHRYRMAYPGFSFYSLNGSLAWANFLLVLTALLAIGLFWGRYAPRVFAAASWIMILSLHHRNPFAMYGADVLLQVALFWLIFLPLEGPTKKGEKGFCNGVSAALLLQIVTIYAFAGWQKNGADWLNGTAIFYSLNIGMYSTPIGEWFSHFQILTEIVNFSVLYLERFGWLLFLIPSSRAWVRTMGVVLFAGMHAAFGVGLNLAFFTWLDIALLVLLIPTEAWDEMARTKIPVPQIFTARQAPPRWVPVAAFAFAIWFLLINFQVAKVLKLSAWSNRVATVFRLHQGWELFAPSPYHYTNWFVIVAETPDGKQTPVQVHGFGAKSFSRPEVVANTFPTLDWMRFYPVLMSTRRAIRTGRHFGRFTCRVLNREKKMNAVKVSIYLMRDAISHEPIFQPEVKTDLLLSGNCRTGEFETFAVNW